MRIRSRLRRKKSRRTNDDTNAASPPDRNARRSRDRARCFAVAPRAEAAPVALVTDVVGDVRQGQEPLKLLVELDAGRELALAADATVVVFYVADGSEWVLKGPGRYRLAGKGPEAQGSAPAAQKRPGPPAFRDIKLRPDRVRQAAVILRGRQPDAEIAGQR